MGTLTPASSTGSIRSRDGISRDGLSRDGLSRADSEVDGPLSNAG